MDTDHGNDRNRNIIPLITVVTLIAVSVLLAALSSFSPLSVFGVLFTAAASGFISFVCGTLNSSFPLTAGAAAYVLALLFFGQPVQAMAACAFIPCALMMNTARRYKFNRSKSILMISAALGAAAVFYLSLTFVLKRGGLTATVFTTAYEEFMTGLREDFAKLSFSEEIIDTMIGYMLVLSPSLAVCLLFFTAYLTTAFYGMLCGLFRLQEKLLPVYPWTFEMSVVSACVFLTAYAVTLILSSGKTTVVSLTAENIIIMLTPGFALLGVTRIKDRIKTKTGGITTAIIGIMALVLLFYNLAAFFITVSFFGVIGTVADSIKTRMMHIK